MIASIETACGPLWISGGEDAVDAVSWTPLEGMRHRGELDWILLALDAYFDGRIRQFPGSLFFMGPGVQWTRMQREIRPLLSSQEILSAIAGIPFGSTMTYGEIASRIGKPGAARAVGAVCRSNHLPVIIPCHRVVGARSIGGYSPDIRYKEYLLSLESGTR